MENKNIKSRGLPGGPNEVFEYITGVFSTDGYKRNSPDVNNPFNVIKGNQDGTSITMEDVDFPVMGTDNLGNQQAMIPGNNYQFPGDQVYEKPMAQNGGEHGEPEYISYEDWIDMPSQVRNRSMSRLHPDVRAVVDKKYNEELVNKGTVGTLPVRFDSQGKPIIVSDKKAGRKYRDPNAMRPGVEAFPIDYQEQWATNSGENKTYDQFMPNTTITTAQKYPWIPEGGLSREEVASIQNIISDYNSDEGIRQAIDEKKFSLDGVLTEEQAYNLIKKDKPLYKRSREKMLKKGNIPSIGGEPNTDIAPRVQDVNTGNTAFNDIANAFINPMINSALSLSHDPGQVKYIPGLYKNYAQSWMPDTFGKPEYDNPDYWNRTLPNSLKGIDAVENVINMLPPDITKTALARKLFTLGKKALKKKSVSILPNTPSFKDIMEGRVNSNVPGLPNKKLFPDEAINTFDIYENLTISDPIFTPSSSINAGTFDNLANPDFTSYISEPISPIFGGGAFDNIEQTAGFNVFKPQKKSFKKKINEKLMNINESLGAFIDNKLNSSSSKKISLNDLESSINKQLEKGLGVKKIDMPLRVKASYNGFIVETKPASLVKLFPEAFSDPIWLQNAPEWQSIGSISLGKTNEVKARSFTDILKGANRYNELGAPGFHKKSDFPYRELKSNPKLYDFVDGKGVSGEINKSIKEELQKKGAELFSGGTGHTPPGARRYVKEFLSGRAIEIIKGKGEGNLTKLSQLKDEWDELAKLKPASPEFSEIFPSQIKSESSKRAWATYNYLKESLIDKVYQEIIDKGTLFRMKQLGGETAYSMEEFFKNYIDLPEAQTGTSINNEFSDYPLIAGFNPNAGVDKRFIKNFNTRVISPGLQGSNIYYDGPSNEGEVIGQLEKNERYGKILSNKNFIPYTEPKIISNVNLRNKTNVEFEGNIEDEEKMLKKLNRQNFLGARGFRGSGWKNGLNDNQIQEFKDDNPFFKKGRVREIDYDLTKADPTKNIYYNDPGSYKFQTGGEPTVVEVGRGPAGLLDKPYWDPENVNLTYDEDEVYESVFDPRIIEKNKANQSAEDNYKKALDERQKEILDIEKAKKLYREVWTVDFKDSTATTAVQARKWAQTQPKWKEAADILDKYSPPSTKLKSTKSKTGFTYKAKYDVNADLSDMYPEMPVLNKPFPNIKYNLSDLPENINEADFRQWVNYYYPDYAKDHEIDSVTPSRAGNDIIKSAWYELGDQYFPQEKLKTKSLEKPFIKSELAPFINQEKSKLKPKGILRSVSMGDGRVVIQDQSTGGTMGMYNTAEQARVAMLEFYTDGYNINSAVNETGADVQKLYDVAESQGPYIPNEKQINNQQIINNKKAVIESSLQNNRPQSNYEAMKKLKGYADGGHIAKAQTGTETSSEQAWIRDFNFTQADLDYLNDDGAYCPDGGCLEQSFKAQDKLIGNKTGFPTSQQVKKSINLQSDDSERFNYDGKTLQRRDVTGKDKNGSKKYGDYYNLSPKSQKYYEDIPYFNTETGDFSADSWDIHGALVKGGGTNIYTRGVNMENKSLGNYSEAELKKLYSQITIGTIIGWSENSNGGYNNEFGLSASNHSTMVVGFDERGVPVIYDWGNYTPIDAGNVNYRGNWDNKKGTTSEEDKGKQGTLKDFKHISNITYPKNVAGKTYDWLKKNKMFDTTPDELNLNKDALEKELYSKGDRKSLTTFYNSLSSHKMELMNEMNISNKDYDMLSAVLLAQTMQESTGGDSFEDNYVPNWFSKWQGDTQGLTQLNINNILDDKMLAPIAKKFGITEESDLFDPEKSAIASMIYAKRNLSAGKSNYKKGKGKKGLRTFYPREDIRETAGMDVNITFNGYEFKTEEGKIVDFFTGAKKNIWNPLSGVGWDKSIKDIQAEFEKIAPGKYKVREEDGVRVVDKITEGNGNITENRDLTDIEIFTYNWQSPTSLITGDAQGGSEYTKNVMKIYEKLKKSNPKKKMGGQIMNPDSKEGLKKFNEGGSKVSNADMDIYKAFFNEDIKGSKAQKIYDKLNRAYYKEAKAKKMSSPNYILTHIITA